MRGTHQGISMCTLVYIYQKINTWVSLGSRFSKKMKHKPHDVCCLLNIKHFLPSLCLSLFRFRITTHLLILILRHFMILRSFMIKSGNLVQISHQEISAGYEIQLHCQLSVWTLCETFKFLVLIEKAFGP